MFPTARDAGFCPQPAGDTGTDLPTIPGYAIEAVLGRGGMGIVYKARDLRLNRCVALKMLLSGMYATSPERERFLREAEAVASLRHGNVVQVFGAAEHDGRSYFTMEYVEGGSLAQRLSGAPQPASQAASLVAVLAEAIQAAHQGGIVHRDLKPGNILLQSKAKLLHPGPDSKGDGLPSATGFRIEDFLPKIADFGLARHFDEGPVVTLSGARVGTPSYMSPEQARGQTRAIGPATDIYSLGALLYELLTGRPPFLGETAAETEWQVAHHEPVAPPRLNAKVPRDLETICLKCLQKAPQHRYVSAEALADDLGRFREGRPIRARPLGRAARVWRWGRRKPTAAGLLVTLVALFSLTVGGGLWLERQRAERQGRAREAVEAGLALIPSLRQQGRWPEAEAILTQARSRLDEAGSDDLRRRLAEAEEQLRLAAVLERVRLTPAIDGNRLDYRSMAEAYAHAFEHAGLEITGDEEAVVDRIRISALRPQLVTALDHWAYVADARGDRRSMARLLGLAQRCDPDPQWGDRFRAPKMWGDPEALRRLAEEVEHQLAGEATETGPPTPLVALLAKKLGPKEGQAEALLRSAQRRHPADFSEPSYSMSEAAAQA